MLIIEFWSQLIEKNPNTYSVCSDYQILQQEQYKSYNMKCN